MAVLKFPVAAAALLAAAAVWAKTYLTQPEALALAFGKDAKVERRSAFLKPEQQARAAELAGEPVPSALVSFYIASVNGAEVGRAYFDTHRVRTLPETVMVVVDPAGTVKRLEVLSFDEPEEYRPRSTFYAQLPGRKLDEDLSLRRKIRPVTGATLTATATVSASRRALALDRVIREAEAARATHAAGNPPK
jgi:hypothetical protein